MRWLYGITGPRVVWLEQAGVSDGREGWGCAAVHVVTKVGHNWVTEQFETAIESTRAKDGSKAGTNER